jgi:hypothetical protein
MATATIDSGLFRNPNRDLVVNIKGTKKPLEDDFAYPKQEWFWTGKAPVHGSCPGVKEDGHMTSLQLPNCSEVRPSRGRRGRCRLGAATSGAVHGSALHLGGRAPRTTFDKFARDGGTASPRSPASRHEH